MQRAPAHGVGGKRQGFLHPRAKTMPWDSSAEHPIPSTVARNITNKETIVAKYRLGAVSAPDDLPRAHVAARQLLLDGGVVDRKV